MKVAIASQNKKSITDHAGRCRKFWLFDIENKAIVDQQLLELSKEQAFHGFSHDSAHPLDQVDMLIAGGMGKGFVSKMAKRNIQAVATTLQDPEQAARAIAAGVLPIKDASENCGCDCGGKHK